MSDPDTLVSPLVVVRSVIRFVLAVCVLGAACVLGVSLWRTYMVSPWTRDGRVRAYVVDVAPEVSGTVVSVPVRDNQPVRKGDPLFVIDPVRFRLAISEAGAKLAAAKEDLRLRVSDAKRRAGLAGIVSAEEQERFASVADTQRAAVDQAQAALDVAKLNLQRATLYSPVNGFITNLSLRTGDFVSAGQARVAVLDRDSFWVNGYFEETKLHGIAPGAPARIKLMGFKPLLHGHVDSIAAGINDQNGNPDRQGLQDVNPIFTWVRLAQRIPVRIHLDQVPADVVLAAGMTCSVSVGPEQPDRVRLSGWLQDHL